MNPALALQPRCHEIWVGIDPGLKNLAVCALLASPSSSCNQSSDTSPNTLTLTPVLWDLFDVSVQSSSKRRNKGSQPQPCPAAIARVATTIASLSAQTQTYLKNETSYVDHPPAPAPAPPQTHTHVRVAIERQVGPAVAMRSIQHALHASLHALGIHECVAVDPRSAPRPPGWNPGAPYRTRKAASVDFAEAWVSNHAPAWHGLELGLGQGTTLVKAPSKTLNPNKKDDLADALRFALWHQQQPSVDAGF